ncbi:MAG: hypothetical protein H7831_05105 [Magnetococcus sp. WYHC-3]
MSTKGSAMGITEERIEHQGQLMALILRGSLPVEERIRFFTPPELSQQLAVMCHPPGHVIAPHVHLPVSREVFHTQEVLVLRRGRVRVDFYTEERQLLTRRELQAGDILLLVRGGHGFEVSETLEMIEIKQGPYVGDRDKERFSASGVQASQEG